MSRDEAAAMAYVLGRVGQHEPNGAGYTVQCPFCQQLHASVYADGGVIRIGCRCDKGTGENLRRAWKLNPEDLLYGSNGARERKARSSGFSGFRQDREYLSQAEAEDEPWAEPVPFGVGQLAGFPVDALPGWLAEWVEQEARATQTPADLGAMLVLAQLGMALAKKLVVQARPGWREPVNLYVAVFLESGNRKSRVFGDATAPARRWQREQADMKRRSVAEAETAKNICEKKLEHLKSLAAKASDPGERMTLEGEAKALAAEIASMRVPALPLLIADDIPPEALAKVMSEQGERLAIMSPEGDIFDIMAGRYSGQVNIGIYLKAHAGDEYRSDRITRLPVDLKSPALTFGLSPQPDVLRGLAEHREFRGRGLLARFLYSIPASPLGQREVLVTPVDSDTANTYTRGMRHLLDLPVPMAGAEPPALRWARDAEELSYETERWLEPQLRRGDMLGSVQDWGAKWFGAVCRIAGLFHCALEPDDPQPWQREIAASTLGQAIAVGRYLVPHALAGFGEMGVDPAVEDARAVLEVIQQWGVAAFRHQQLWRKVQDRTRFQTVTPLDAALQALVERGYLRAFDEEVERPKGGRPRKPSYRVHPSLSGENR